MIILSGQFLVINAYSTKPHYTECATSEQTRLGRHILYGKMLLPNWVCTYSVMSPKSMSTNWIVRLHRIPIRCEHLRLSPLVMSLRLSPFSSSHPLESGEVNWFRLTLARSSCAIRCSSLIKPFDGSFLKTISLLVTDDTSSIVLLFSAHSVPLSDLYWLSVEWFLCGFDRILSMEKLFLIVIVFSEFILYGVEESQSFFPKNFLPFFNWKCTVLKIGTQKSRKRWMRVCDTRRLSTIQGYTNIWMFITTKMFLLSGRNAVAQYN